MKKQLALLIPVLVFSVGVAAGQVCPNPTPPGYDGLNGNGSPNPNNQAQLDIFTNSDSTNPAAFDNTAHASLGEPINISFRDTRVAPGSPFAIVVRVGIPAPIVAPTFVDGQWWLGTSAANFFPFVDGIGINQVPSPFATTAGPNFANQFFVNTGLSPSNLGLCLNLQTLVIDPAAPSPAFLSLSNPVALGIVPGITSVTPNIAVAGSTVTLGGPGLTAVGGDLVVFGGGSVAVTGPGRTAMVPLGAVSGRVGVSVGGISSVPSVDGLNDYLAVIDALPVFTAGALALNVDPNLPAPGSSRATGFSTLPAAGGTEMWSVQATAGDIIRVEVLSTDAGFGQVLDGFGATINPFATQGFDPFVTMQQATNLDTLVFDTGLTGPFNLHLDDDDGPGLNASLVWQAKYTGTYNIVVADANPVAFVTGSYALNVVVEPGAPCVTGFVNATGGRINVVPQGGTIIAQSPNIVVGSSYTVTLTPRAGPMFNSRVITSIIATTANQLTIPIPATQPGDLPMGLHQVQIRDDIFLRDGLVWDNSRVRQPRGVLPDVLCIRGATLTNLTTANLAPVAPGHAFTAVNTQSLLYPATSLAATNVNQGFIQVPVPGGAQFLYIEALGVDLNTPALIDAGNQFTGGALGIYNPNLKVFAPSLLVQGPYNDDDGVVPFPIFPVPLGIGLSSGIIDFTTPLAFPAGGTYLLLIQENILFGVGASHSCLINAVVL